MEIALPPDLSTFSFGWGDSGTGHLIVDKIDQVAVEAEGRTLSMSSEIAKAITGVLRGNPALASDRSLVRLITNDGSSVPFDNRPS